MMIRPQFDRASNFNGGLVQGWIDNERYYINRSGEKVWQLAQ